MKVVPKVEVPEWRGWEAFFMSLYEGRPALTPLRKPCHDCAVVCGFYHDYTDGLATVPPELQSFVRARWFCHNNNRRACGGIQPCNV